MRRAFLCAVLAAAFVPSSAGAQSVTLSESEALARLSSDSPRVRAIRAGVELTRADVLAASRWPNPRFTLDREAVAGITEYLTMVSQLLPITGRRGFEVQSASASVSATSSRADDDVRRLRADLRLAYADLLTAQTRERQLTAARDRLRELADVLARRESAGDAAGFDRLRAEREVLDIETDLATAATDRARAQAVLASFLTEAAFDSPLVATPSQAAPAAVPPLAALLEQAESTRGELVALGHDLESARLAARAAERRLVPEPEVVAGTKSSTAGSGDIGSVVTVHAAIPLFDRAHPERAMAAARVTQAEARAQSLRATLRGQVTALREAVIQRRAAADRYRAEAVETITQIERIAQLSYDAGERGILELLDAYRLGTSARVRQAALDLAVRQAEIELEFATGWESSL
jgi:cobalt-zinc-cadmium efflux system outer membrane protein